MSLTSHAWVKPFRAQLRSSTSSGWFVRPDRHGNARLLVQIQGKKGQTLNLGHSFTKAESGKILILCSRLFELVKTRGIDIKTAFRLVNGNEIDQDSSWESALDGFKKRMALNISEKTWEDYETVINLALGFMSSHRPAASGTELIEMTLSRWPAGTRRRKLAAQQLSRFLRYRIEMGQLTDNWSPPPDLTELIGIDIRPKPKNYVPNKTTELKDQEIVSLINSFPDTAAGKEKADAICLIAELGLRPHELNFLSVKADPSTGEKYFHCSYQKRAGAKHRTKSRRLYPFPIKGTNWNLLERWQSGDIKLPSLSAGNGAAECLMKYLKRRSYWKELEAAYAARGENIAIYSLRNSYCLRCNKQGLPLAAVADAMGNTPDVLMAKYTWANESSTAEAFQKIVA